ncbi:YdcF family protein [Chlorogloeopsis sp. ULAP01]|uniref:YdcF family protein n=1 Tax=Chlorogloeopsis sp. ULAP01 TaxID=3056483 RepID=UPI0025AA5433|nr:YdcF family protein [Chlorogloeopsis sp. ULAP01]MDM9382704.1 YdcF family protein [Chlorogloeopsis sp. ULAP01]
MLDPSLCERPASQWLALKSTLQQWLMIPSLIVLVCVALVFLPWIIPFLRELRWRRLFTRLGILLCALYLIVTFPLTTAVIKKGLWAFVPKDPGTTEADAIVILGRGPKFRPSRVEVAAELWKSQRAPLIFASGAGDGQEIVEELKAQGVPDDALAEEHCSRTTKENAIFAASVLKPRGVEQILLVTDPPHMLRSVLTFRNLGFEVIPHSSPLPNYLPRRKKAVLMFYESMGLLSYGLQGRLLPRDLTTQHQDSPVAKLENSSQLQPQNLNLVGTEDRS